MKQLGLAVLLIPVALLLSCDIDPPSGNVPPTAATVAIAGSARVNEVLTGSYVYGDEDGDAEGSTLVQWLAADGGDGTYEAISGATGNTYTIGAEQEGRYLRFRVTPVAVTGETTGTPVQSDAVGPVEAVVVSNSPPVAASVAISGTSRVGMSLVGSYTYYDVNGDAEGATVLQWLAADSSDGTYEAVSGATGDTYTISAEQEGRYLRFQVTPIAATGETTGTPVQSDAVGPVEATPGSESSYVPGGTFYRGYDGDTYTDDSYPATIGGFYMERYEVTVGQFRAFVNAYNGTAPSAGEGAHPEISGSGWQGSWDDLLPANQADLITMLKSAAGYTWTDTPDSNESSPINSVSWYVAFAYCVWSGGRLPTEAEFNFAACGGSEQRPYPWGSAAASTSYAVYSASAPADVGSRPSGAALWQSEDLAGNVAEWIFDYYAATYPDPGGTNPAQLSGTNRVVGGGSYADAAANLLAGARSSADPASYVGTIGFRCVYD